MAAVVAAAGVGVQAVKADPGPALPVLGAPSAASLAAQDLLTDLAGAPLRLTRDDRGLAHLVGTEPGHAIPLPAGVSPRADTETQARAHLDRAAALFGIADVAKELRAEPADPALGNLLGTDRVLRFQQLAGGVPVLGGELVVVLDTLGALKSVTGETAPAPDRSAASVTAERAEQTALAAVLRRHPDAHVPAVKASAPELWHLDPALLGVPADVHMAAGPVWRTEVADRGAVRELVLVDARTGTIPLQLNLITHANRAICDGKNKADRSELGADCKPAYARAEGQAASAPPPDVDQAYENTGATSEFFRQYVGVDLTALLGIDTGDGKRLRSTVRFCPGDTLCSATNGTAFDNAFWNGRGMYYGDGWAQADDIVAHELTHGVTEKTAKLLYLYQSGAINESMSDIFGELVDLTNGIDGGGTQTPWAVGEDAPLLDSGLPVRDMANPPATLLPVGGQPDRMTAGNYDADLFFVDNGGVHNNSGVGNKAAFLIADGGVFNGQNVAGIGRDKTATLYYRVLRMLSSGADYADLGGVLNQACANLVGSAGFTSASCAEVGKAVAATEMANQPPGRAAAPEAPVCPSGTRKVSVLADGFENFSKKRWALDEQWAVISDYAKSGTHSIYGFEPDRQLSSSATLKDTVVAPRGVKSYLRFAHQYRLDHGLLETGLVDRFYDGAVLEYRVDGGSWKSASDRGWENGPTKNIDPDPGARYKAFGGDSRGYLSSRLDLGFLAGKKAEFRWKIIGDRAVAFDGWTVDDVDFYACGTTKPSDVRGLKVKVKSGGVATVSWSSPVYKPAAGISGYKVIRKGGGAKKQTVKVSAGKRSVKFQGLKKGAKYKFVVVPQSKGGAGPDTTSKAITAK